jgi:predicted nuclease with TOPRIM domain
MEQALKAERAMTEESLAVLRRGQIAQDLVLTDIRGKVTEHGRQLSKLHEKFDQLGGRFDRLSGRVDEHGAQLTGLHEKFDGLSGRVDQLDGRVDRLEGKVDRLDGKVDGIAETLQEVLARLPARPTQPEQN